MAKLTAAKYEKKTSAEAPNPFIDVVKAYTDKGVDTAFAVEFNADTYKAEKLQIQKAVNANGFSAREVETDWDAEQFASGVQETVKSLFVIRPPRKTKAEATPDA